MTHGFHLKSNHNLLMLFNKTLRLKLIISLMTWNYNYDLWGKLCSIFFTASCNKNNLSDPICHIIRCWFINTLFCRLSYPHTKRNKCFGALNLHLFRTRSISFEIYQLQSFCCLVLLNFCCSFLWKIFQEKKIRRSI